MTLKVTRATTPKDAAICIDLLMQRVDDISYSGEFDSKRVSEVAARVITHPDYCAFIGHSFLPITVVGGVLIEQTFNYEKRAVIELFASRTSGGSPRDIAVLISRSIDAFIAWGRERGATRVVAAYDSGMPGIDRLGKLLNRKGFYTMGEIFARELV